jgi:membrane protease YdiL (CAAX protease family)
LTVPPGPDGPESPAASGPTSEPSPGNGQGPEPTRRPGASTFTIEGRSAPGLFVAGWLATLLGIGAVVVSVMAAPGLGQGALLVGGLILLSIGLVAGAGAQAIERRARGGRQYVGPSPFLLFLAAIPIYVLGVLAVGTAFTLLGQSVQSPAAILASLVVQALVYVGLIRLLVVDTGALSWADMGIRRPDATALRQFGYGALWTGAAILATIPVALILSTVVRDTPPSPLPPAGETVGTLVNLLAGVVIAPAGEEVFFRGFAATAWVAGMGARPGIVRAALFFALAHVLTIGGTDAGPATGQALAAFAGRIPVSLLLTWLFVRHRSIWVPLGLHAGFNALLLVLAEAVARSGAAPT